MTPVTTSVGVLAALLACVLTACSSSPSGPTSGSSGSGGSTPKATGSAVPSAAATTPADFVPVPGTSMRFALPRQPEFTLDSTTTNDAGAVSKRWRHLPAAGAGRCVVLAVEQARFSGQFPQSTLQLFEARTLPQQQNLQNAALPNAPAGTVAGVAQEATYQATLEDGSSVPARVMSRTYLTTARTLISLTVTGPEQYVDSCRLRDILATFAAGSQA